MPDTFSVYSIWRSDSKGVSLAAEIRPDDDPPPDGILVEVPDRAPAMGETVVCRMTAGMTEQVADEMAQAYIETMESMAREAGATVGSKRSPADAPGRPSIPALALKHSTLCWPKKKRNADLRRHPDGPDKAATNQLIPTCQEIENELGESSTVRRQATAGWSPSTHAN